MKKLFFGLFLLIITLGSIENAESCWGQKSTPKHRFVLRLLDTPAQLCHGITDMKIVIWQTWYDEARGLFYSGIIKEFKFGDQIEIAVPPARSAAILRSTNVPVYVIHIYVGGIFCSRSVITYEQIDSGGSGNIPIFISSSCCTIY